MTGIVRRAANVVASYIKPIRTAVQDAWSDASSHYYASGKLVYWEGVPEVTRYQFEMMTGDPELSYIDATIRRLRDQNRTGLKGLALGCVENEPPERQFCATGLFAQFDVMDLSGPLLERQANAPEVADLPLRYHAVDLNAVDLPANEFDLIWAVGTIHHVRKLDRLFAQINRALTSTGIFVCREYVGPDYIQFTDQQLSLANALLQCIPEEFRTYPDGTPKRAEPRLDLDWVKEYDPSESEQSSKIVPAMHAQLRMEQFSKTGGTILHPLLNGIAYHFVEPAAARYLRLAIEWEKQLIADGRLASDYIFAVGRKRA